MASEATYNSLPNAMSKVAISKKKVEKRRNYIDWEEYFMAIACVVSNRSKDPVTQVGACVVNRNNRIVGHGYNGMPRGCTDSAFPWGKHNENPLENKYFYVCHAEMNAIFNKNCADISKCVIYTVLFPCNQCVKSIIQSGISEVVYLGDKNSQQITAIAGKRMMDASRVRYRQFKPSCRGFRINLRTGVCEVCPTSSIQPEQKKREMCLPWDDYFLAISILVAKRSKCPSLQLGACIVNKDNCVVGLGYNGMPNGCSDDDFPWGTDDDDPLECKDLYECHAELNAILNAGWQVKDCVMYCIAFPCSECAKAMIQSGIKKLMYLQGPTNESTFQAAQKMFDAAGLICRLYTPKQDKIFVDFSLIET